MYRLSLIISEIYNKYLPLAEKDGIVLNLDFSDPTKEISDPDRVKKYLDENLSSTLKRSDKGEVTIGVSKDAITITDSATTLSHAACALLSNRYIDVTSRVGFGTTVKIFLKPRDLPTEPKEHQPLQIEGAAAAISVDNTAAEPTLQSEVRLAAKQGKQKHKLSVKLKLTGQKKTAKSATAQKTAKKSLPAKTTKTAKAAKPAKVTKATKKSTKKTDRQLAAAAKKADREVKRIAKKAKKNTSKKAKRKLEIS